MNDITVTLESNGSAFKQKKSIIMKSESQYAAERPASLLWIPSI